MARKLPFEQYQLNNGLTVILEHVPGMLAAGQLRVFQGALNEREGEEGLAHFFEHALVTCGTKKYSPEAFVAFMDSFGNANATTSLDHISFPFEWIPGDIENFLDIASQVAFYPLFDPPRLLQEREAVIREISNTKSQLKFHDNREFTTTFYGKSSPHSYFILGKESVVRGTSISGLTSFHERGFGAKNAELTLIGNLPRNIQHLVSRYFDAVPPGNGARFMMPRNEPLTEITVIHRPAPDLFNSDTPEQSNAKLKIALYGPSLEQSDSTAFELINEILGGGMTSRLFQRIRVEEGLAYSIGSMYDGTRNQGRLDILGDVHASRADQAIDAIFDEMNYVRTHLIEPATLSTIRRRKIFEIAKMIETCEGRVLMHELRRDYDLTPDKFLSQIGKVTRKQILQTAEKYLPKSRDEGNYVLLLRDPLK